MLSNSLVSNIQHRSSIRKAGHMNKDGEAREIVKAMMNVEMTPSFPKEEAKEKGLLELSLTDLAASGMAFASLADALGLLAQSAPTIGEQLFKIDWRGYSGVLAELKGDPGKYITTVIGDSGIAGQAGLVPVDVAKAASSIDPYMLMLSAAIAGIEDQLKEIKEISKQIIDFLEEDKKAAIRGNINVLADIMNNYKYNIGNERFRETRHQQVLDIRRDAEKDIEFYRARIERCIADKKYIQTSSKVADKLKKLSADFGNYQAALYQYGFSTFLEVMLLENFEEDYLKSVSAKLEKYSLSYRQLYTEASEYIEEQSRSSVRAGVLSGIAAAGKGLGQVLGSMPVLKEGPVDELLVDGGNTLASFKDNLTKNDIEALAARKDNCAKPFKENLETVYLAYHKPMQAFTDGDKVWLKLNVE